jgi:type I restriction enzyme S subunit
MSKSNYKPLGKYIQPVIGRNGDLGELPLMGLSISKKFIPSIANTIGTDMSTYRIIEKNQFAYGPVTSRNGDKITIALFNDYEKALISQAYIPFEVKNSSELDPEYLMMWFRRPEFDRYARFKSHGSAREIFDWDEMCNTLLPVPSITKQREIVKEYNVVQNRIALNQQMIKKLEETAQAVYRRWFVEFEFPDAEGKPYKSNGGEMVWCEELGKEVPKGWEIGKMEDVTKIIMGQSPDGESYNTEGIGTPLINGPVEFGDYFTNRSKWTTSVTKLSEVGDLIICVRGSTTGRYVKSDGRYCIGRGVCSFRAKHSQTFVDLLYKNNINKLLSYTTGSTFPNWDGQTLANYPIIVPRKAVIKAFETKVNAIIKYIENLSMELEFTIKMKDLLLSKLATIEN